MTQPRIDTLRTGWNHKVRRLRGEHSVQTDLTPYRSILERVTQAGKAFADKPDSELAAASASLRRKARSGDSIDTLLVPAFALVREASSRVLGMRPYDVQVIAATVLHNGGLAEMATGEGKTLAAVMPAYVNALSGEGVHVLTFNDYLARRDAAWMSPIYNCLGLTVGVIQETYSADERRRAYHADVTYATAKEAGFDFLRMQLCRDPKDIVHRRFHYAIVDEADSILIDEARIPLVIAGDRHISNTSPYRIAELVAELREGAHWEIDEGRRNVFLTDEGLDLLERDLPCDDLHDADHYLLLTEINQALHARVLLHRDVDYIVRSDRVELVDAFTGRVVDDRRWPDGLQAALEAKEKLDIQPGGRILGSTTLPHFLKRYPKLAGMTATAQQAATELERLYGLRVVPIPSNAPCVRNDLPDVVFTHAKAKDEAIVAEILREHPTGRPLLAGTSSVRESETLSDRLQAMGVRCRVLNARNDEAEADIIADAGAVGAVTISTNMAGRGTDIRLGGKSERDRAAVVQLGGLYVIGTTRQESRRVDDQLRGRCGRQGDPGTSRFFVSLEDEQMVRFGIDALIPNALRPPRQREAIDNPIVRREVERLQRIVEGQNAEIRKTLMRYTALVEQQRAAVHEWREQILRGDVPDVCRRRAPAQYGQAVSVAGAAAVKEAERAILLHHIDECWADHLAYVSHLREGIHLVGIGGLDPITEFHKAIAKAFPELHETIEQRTVDTFESVKITPRGIDLDHAGLRGPSSTWTYLVNDRILTDLQQMLFGQGNIGFAAGAIITWPLLAAWGVWERMKRARS